MEMLSESKKILLAKLKFRDIERYERKLNFWGVSESEILDYIQRENTRIESIKKDYVKKDRFMTGYVYYMGGSPYWSSEPKDGKKIIERIERDNNRIKVKDSGKTIIAIDGDNHWTEAVEGIERVSDKEDIIIYAADENVLKKIKGKKGVGDKVKTVSVKRGNQAVDNRIKTELGKVAKEHSYSKIIIISHDQGYNDIIKKWRKKWKWSGDKIILCKCVKDVFDN